MCIMRGVESLLTFYRYPFLSSNVENGTYEKLSVAIIMLSGFVTRLQQQYRQLSCTTSQNVVSYLS